MSLQPISDRLLRLSIPEPNSGCWLWLGTTRNGYGRLVVGSVLDGSQRCQSAHRLSYEAFVGPIPAGMFICHKCDTPACINPSHLFPGTPQENASDMLRKNRKPHTYNGPIGADRRWSKLTDADVRSIRQSRETQKALGERFGVSPSRICRIRRLQEWRHVK